MNIKKFKIPSVYNDLRKHSDNFYCVDESMKDERILDSVNPVGQEKALYTLLDDVKKKPLRLCLQKNFDFLYFLLDKECWDKLESKSKQLVLDILTDGLVKIFLKAESYKERADVKEHARTAVVMYCFLICYIVTHEEGKRMKLKKKRKRKKKTKQARQIRR
eukprot:UN28139